MTLVGNRRLQVVVRGGGSARGSLSANLDAESGAAQCVAVTRNAGEGTGRGRSRAPGAAWEARLWLRMRSSRSVLSLALSSDVSHFFEASLSLASTLRPQDLEEPVETSLVLRGAEGQEVVVSVCLQVVASLRGLFLASEAPADSIGEAEDCGPLRACLCSADTLRPLVMLQPGAVTGAVGAVLASVLQPPALAALCAGAATPGVNNVAWHVLLALVAPLESVCPFVERLTDPEAEPVNVTSFAHLLLRTVMHPLGAAADGLPSFLPAVVAQLVGLSGLSESRVLLELLVLPCVPTDATPDEAELHTVLRALVPGRGEEYPGAEAWVARVLGAARGGHPRRLRPAAADLALALDGAELEGGLRQLTALLRSEREAHPDFHIPGSVQAALAAMGPTAARLPPTTRPPPPPRSPVLGPERSPALPERLLAAVASANRRGWLNKLSNGAMGQRWQRRYFVLEGDTLSRYASEAPRQLAGLRVDLANGTVRFDEEERTLQLNGMAVWALGKRGDYERILRDSIVLSFAGEEEEEERAWVEALTAATQRATLARHRPRFPSGSVSVGGSLGSLGSAPRRRASATNRDQAVALGAERDLRLTVQRQLDASTAELDALRAQLAPHSHAPTHRVAPFFVPDEQKTSSSLVFSPRPVQISRDLPV